jgi:hypothetical protein
MGVLSSIFRYFGSRSALRVAFDFSALMVVIGWLGIVWFSIHNYPEAAAIWNSLRHDSKIVDVRSSVALNGRINTELGTVLDKLAADRVGLSRFHNGRRGLDGIHFIYSSRSHEVLGRGIGSAIQRSQSLPLSLFNAITARMIETGCYVAESITPETTSTSVWWSEQGTSALIQCSVLGTQGDIVGYVSAEWLEPLAGSQVIPAAVAVKDAAARLSLLLSLQ